MSEKFAPEPPALDRRVVFITSLSIGLAAVAALIAVVLMKLIALVTNLSFYGRFSAAPASPSGNHLGWFVVFVPVIGGIIVGFMARYGSKAIRGHGIPEAMEQVLLNESRIPPRVTLLKPLSAAISIGTGGPFGAEGPIIATGGALGSLIGQLLDMTPNERKTLLAAGAAAGMAATFGSPVSAVLLAVELLLFEYRSRSLVPVALAATTACGVRVAFQGTAPAFAMGAITQPSGPALAVYIGLGAFIGLLSVGVTRAVYAIEDAFEKLPVHWMWWPAIGAVAVGVVGVIAPKTMGVGYDNIEWTLSGNATAQALLALTLFKFISWAISLGSGTSGGTLAPLFTIGGGLGGLVGIFLAHSWPQLGVDPRIGALVGMAAMFAGASRALLASVVFAFETTRQPMGMLPLLGGCSAGFLISSLLMRHSIMTEKIARRGVRVSNEYSIDGLAQLHVGDFATRSVATVGGSEMVAEILARLGREATTHHGYPVLGEGGAILGVITRRDLLEAALDKHAVDLVRGAALTIASNASLREAVNLMASRSVGRLAVVEPDEPTKLAGILTRGDVIAAHGVELKGSELSPALAPTES